VTSVGAMADSRSLRAPLCAAAAAVLVVGAGACGADSREELTIYSGRSENLVGPILEQFNEQTGIDIAVRYGDGAELALLLDTEGGESPADVYFTESPGALSYLDANDRFSPLPASVLDRVPATDRADDGDWVGTTGRLRVLVRNTDLVGDDEMPTSVFDLTDPAWEGRVGITPNYGAFQDFVANMAATEGAEATAAWLDGLAANDVRRYANNSALIDAVTRGAIAVGLTNHYYVARVLADDPSAPIAAASFADGDPGNLVLVAGAGVLATNDQGDAAARFVEYLLSDEVQRQLTEATFEYPLVDGVPLPSGLTPFTDLAAPRATSFSSLDLPAVQALIDEAGLSS
jgi:iron(III) transport system substrate-binding protein